MSTTAATTAVQQLDVLIGSWNVTGGAEGTVTYRWLDGKQFLIQDVDLVQDGQRIIGMEVIGHLKPFGEEADPQVRSRFYDNLGNTLDYVYRMDGDTLHIWAGEEGSPFAFTGSLGSDGATLSGAWDYAGQGGYDSSMTRIDSQETTP